MSEHLENKKIALLRVVDSYESQHFTGTVSVKLNFKDGKLMSGAHEPEIKF